jgi:hypothetical protein
LFTKKILAVLVFQGEELVFTKSFFSKIEFIRLDFQTFDLHIKIYSSLLSKNTFSDSIETDL